MKMTARNDYNFSKPNKVELKVIEGKRPQEKRTSDYLNERLYVFYNNGGAVMDI